MPPTPPRILASSSSDLFGKDDSGYLDALAEVDLPAPKPPAAPTELPTSDLFGTENSSFLDALSKSVFPEDVTLSREPVLEIINEKSARDSRNSQKRKRSPSPEETFVPGSPNFAGPMLSHAATKDSSAYIDSDIYGASKFHGFGEYMYRKRAKLSIQNNDMEESNGGKKSSLFQGLALYINGKTNPSVQELRKLIIQHGGVFHPYLDRKKMVTHIIASNLTPSKVLEFKNMKVASPSWLLESIQAGTLLPWRDYLIGADRRPDESQGRAEATFAPARSKKFSVETLNKSTQSQRIHSRLEASNEGKITPSSNLSPAKFPAGTQKLFTTDPVTSEQADQIPQYAPSGSNPHAKRKMEDPQWRAANTAVAPGFIEGYYKNSRLHHLSTWKAELQTLVATAAERVENGDMVDESILESGSSGTSMLGVRFQKPASPKKGKDKDSMSRVIMHCDFDSFFVSAGLVDRPHLKGKPVVVCHSQGGQGGTSSTSEVASSSYEARKYGIHNGMSLGQAKKLCPSVHTIPYEFESYKRFSLQFYTILMSYADDLQAVSVDEALVDVTSTVEAAQRTSSEAEYLLNSDIAKDLAETIRTRVRHATGCEVSIGISHNILLARVATRRAKPAGSYHIQPEEVPDILAPLDINDLRGFGWSTRSKVEAKFGVTTLGELAKRPKSALCDVLGRKTGETLWKAIRGIDDTKIESDRVRKSVSSEINYGIRFNCDEDAEKFVRGMAIEVSKRLKAIGMCGRSLSLKVMTRNPQAPVEAPKFLGHGICDTTSKSSPLEGPDGQATADEEKIGESAWRLLKGMHLDPKELRGVGIHVQRLESLSDAKTADRKAPGGQPMIPFKKRQGSPQDKLNIVEKEKSAPAPLFAMADIPPQDTPDRMTFTHEMQSLTHDMGRTVLPSISQVDPTFLDALPVDIRNELEQEYARVGSERVVAGPSRYKSPDVHQPVAGDTPSGQGRHDARNDPNFTLLARQVVPRGASMSPSKQMHPLFAKRKAPVAPKVNAAELKLLDIDPGVWAVLPVDLQREQLAAFRAANVGTGMAVRASMSTQAKQDRIISRWRALRRGSPAVNIKGRRPEIAAKKSELPKLRQRGRSKSPDLRVNEVDEIQAVLGQWIRGFEDDGPRLGDVEYFGKFLERCVETDVGTERAVGALKWWRILLRQRWADRENVFEDVGILLDHDGKNVGGKWWRAFWDVKGRIDNIIKKRFGGGLSLK